MSFKTEQVTEMVENTFEVTSVVCDTCGFIEQVKSGDLGYAEVPAYWGGYYHGPMSIAHLCPTCVKVVEEALAEIRVGSGSVE